MPEPLEKLRQVRIEKLEKIRKLGIEPFPARWEKLESRINAQELRTKGLGAKVVAAGRLMGCREHGKICFYDLVDESGKIQLCFRTNELSTLNAKLLDLLDIGDFIGVEGELFETKTEELSIAVSDFTLLAKSLRPLPEKHEGLKDIETRYRQRYVDLIVNPEVRKVFEARTQIVEELRNYLDQQGFVEVETPILQPVYGGASAKPFITHHNALDVDLYLRISNELYLKRLIVGGFEKVYEFAKDFRNEGISRQHNPEFTQLEFYWAYADYEDLMKFTEEMLNAVIETVTGGLKIEHDGVVLDFTSPWRRITFRDLLLEELDIDINIVNTEDKLKKEIEEKNIKLSLKGVVGYGALVDTLYKETCRPKLVQPTLLLDYPAEMIALAKRKEEDPSKIASFQLLVKGFEVIKAYNELNDPLDQKERWLEMERLAKEGLEEHEALDEDYLRALEYGMPPTAGWGMGIDRFTAIVTNQPSLKDVILFPTLRPEKGFHSNTAQYQREGEPLLEIDPQVKKRFLEMRVGVAVIEGVSVKKETKELEGYKKKFLSQLETPTTEKIGKILSIQAYRELFKATGVDWHSRRPSVEALLRRIATGKGLYCVNNVVDTYNLAVLKSKISLGAFDLDKIALPKVLRFAKEGEEIVLLGETRPTVIHEGELVYADQEGPLTLDLNYRDCDRTKVTTKTKNILLVADGCKGISKTAVEDALDLGCRLVTMFAGGEVAKKFIV